jgi:hypothetical protein
MAYRRVLLIGDKLPETKTELENMFSSKLFKTNYTGVKTKIIVSPVKTDTLVVDLNGEGADTVSKKVKDIGQKNKMKAIIKNEKPMSKVSESKITKSELKQLIKEEINKILSEDAKIISKEFGGYNDSEFLKKTWKMSLEELESLLTISIDELKWLKKNSKGTLGLFNRKDAQWVASRIKFLKQIISSKKKNPNFIPDHHK